MNRLIFLILLLTAIVAWFIVQTVSTDDTAKDIKKQQTELVDAKNN